MCIRDSPVVGAVGGAYDAIYMKRITEYAGLKYRHRYLDAVSYTHLLMMHIPPFLRILLHHLPDSGYARCQYILLFDCIFR